jgi:SAM-dependent methyltransferase
MTATHFDAPVVDDRIDFYRRTISGWLPDRDVRVLVVGAEGNDIDVFRDLGYTAVTLLNLEQRGPELPHGWSFATGDGHTLPYADASFDVVVTHATLHHCRSPHRVLLEMYRVARQTVIFIEARDSLLMRWAEWAGITQAYEVTAVFYNGGTRGGVDDTGVPNYVYRWTEREVEKTIATMAPHLRHEFDYRYGLALPQTPQAMRHARVRAALIRGLRLVAAPLGAMLCRQQNLFAVRIRKPDHGSALQPWLTLDARGEPAFDQAWGRARFLGPSERPPEAVVTNTSGRPLSKDREP